MLCLFTLKTCACGMHPFATVRHSFCSRRAGSSLSMHQSLTGLSDYFDTRLGFVHDFLHQVHRLFVSI
jgi:hypothetical protein